MQRNCRLPIAFLGFVVALAILVSGSFLLNKWLPQPATYSPSTGSPPGSLADDPLDYLPDTGLVQLTSPISTTSYYITSLDLQSLYDLGYALGHHDSTTSGTQDDVVIIDYGYPVRDPNGGGGYGVILAYDATYHYYSNAEVVLSVVNFASGYYGGAYPDRTSHLKIVVGVNNCCSDVDPTVFPNHGAKWAQEVVDVIKYQIGGISNQVDVTAGMDMEMSFNYPYASRQWLDSYISQSSCIPGADNTANGCFFNFGNMAVSASGTTCQTVPPTHVPPRTPTPTPGAWTGCDVWYPSWGAQRSGQPHFARPLPEIYHGHSVSYPWGTDASAWRDLSVFSVKTMAAGPMFFAGSLTQRERCLDNCGSGNNLSWEGFQLLSGALASNTNTRQAMRWSTDIKLQPTPTP